ncbi:hypothetical protein RASY3_11880 [Ruminococcus albus SY3]|uniref:Uncharacterized protein n=1 Tax=Ruminococcus albus SY3 TaxID=1341156 RepID=A0A011VV88_RUMAL|nr:hypothetical protein RASY3_11880 [Ruminococcus albus SY3]
MVILYRGSAMAKSLYITQKVVIVMQWRKPCKIRMPKLQNVKKSLKKIVKYVIDKKITNWYNRIMIKGDRGRNDPILPVLV